MADKLSKNKVNGEMEMDDLIHTYSFPLYLYAKRNMRNGTDAEDIVQECFVRFWEKREASGVVKSIKSYLYTMVRNECIDRIKSKNILEYRDDLALIECRDIESDMEEFDLIELLMAAIETLPPQYSRVMKLAVKGLKNSEIADELGIAENSVKVMKNRSFKKMKELLGDEMLLIIVLLMINE